MFDIGFWELAIIGAIMLVVLGPERLPGVARTAGFWLGKMRRMVNDVKKDVKREMDAAELKELDDVKEQFNKAGNTIRDQFNENTLTTQKPENNLPENSKKEISDTNESSDKS